MSDRRQNAGPTAADAAAGGDSTGSAQAGRALRQRAEAQARALGPTDLSAQTPENIQRALHELRVHQVELEMQNENLRTAQAALDESRARYFDLYDLAPVGYCTLSAQGLILEANLTAAKLLGVARGALVKQPLSRFIGNEDRGIYYRHRKQLVETGHPQECELRLAQPDGAFFWAHLAMTAAQAEYGAPVCRLVLSDITERKQAENALIFLAHSGANPASGDFFQALARYLSQTLDMGFVCIDRLDGDHLTAHTLAVYSNGRFEDNVSYALKDTPCGEVVGKQVCCFPASIKTLFPNDAVLQQMAAESYLGVTLWGHDGRPIGLIAVIGARPLTQTARAESLLKLVAVRAAGELERKLAEDTLRTQEQEFRSLAESMPQIVWVTRPDGWNIYFNQQWMEYTGMSLEESLGHGWNKPFHPDDQRRAWDAWQQATQNNATYSLECRLRRADGAYRWWLIRGVPLRDASGKTLKWFGTCTDIEDIKRAEKDLFELAERYRLANKATNDVIWDWDIIQDTQRWNEAGTAVFGWTEIVERPVSAHWWVERVHPDDQARVHDSFFAVVNNPELDAWHDEYRFRKADGAVAEVLDRGYVLRDEHGKAIRMIGAMQDITDRKRTVEALKMSSQAKSEFLANMSHEIRTPMNAILGLTQILEREALTPDQRDMLHKISDAGTGLLHIINDILDFSKVEAGQLKVDQCPFDLATALESLTSLLKVSAFDKHLELSVPKLAMGEEQLIGDPLRVKQVLLNLASNAIKFTERGRVEIRVIRRLETATSVRLRFEVQDTGIGIAPEALAQLFQAFTQADASTTRRFGGTGLGLAISKRLVDLMGGEIGATSTPNVGSTFWFELPFGRAALAGTVPAAMPSTPATARQPQGPRLSGLRILGVDDNRVNLFMLERALKLEGASVELAADGQQALQTLAAHPRGFDVVLMDIQMPVMDGLTATRAMRANAALATLPVIALTAGVLSDERDATLAAGMNDFLAKPLDIEDMVAKLRLYLPERPAKALPEAAATPPPRQQNADPADPADHDDFPAIAGIDNVRVARLLGQDRAYFLRLLGLFVEEFEALPQQLGVDLARNDRETAIRRVHTLKGSAGNLGMMALMRTASTLETALREDAPNLDAHIEPLRAELGALIDASAPWLSEAPIVDAATPAPPLDPAQLAALQAALRHHDLAAINLHTSLEAALAGVFDAPTCKALAQAIGHLRFEEALQLLERGEP